MTKPARDAHLLSGAYVLNALTPGEVVEMEAAMASSEDLRSEVAELTDTAVLLGLSVPPADPPDALRGRLMALVEATPQLAPLPAAEPRLSAEEGVEPGAGMAARQEPKHVAPVVRGPRHWFQRPSSVLAAAAAVVLLVGGVAAVEHVLVPTGQQSVAQTQAAEFARLTSAPDLQEAHATVAGGGSATVYWSKSERSSAVSLTGETTPASGRVLQLWRVDGATITSAGLFQPVDGHSYTMLKGDLSSTRQLAVSVEPAGGSAQPTTTPIARVALT